MLARFPEVQSVVTRTGRAEVATDPVGQDETEVMVKLRPKEEWKTAHDLDGLGEAIKQAVEGEVPATFVSVSQPIEDRVNQLLAGSRADVVIKVFGQDLDVLKKTADEIGKVVRDIPGRGDWRVQRVLGLPLLEVKPDRQRLARYGMSADRVLEVVEASRVGRYVGQDLRGLAALRSDAAAAAGDADAGGVRRAAGRLVDGPPGAAGVGRDHPRDGGPGGHQPRIAAAPRAGRGQRARPRSGQLRQRGAAKVAQTVKLPEGVTLEWGGQFENFTRASKRLGFVAPLALAVIFAMLFLMFGDLRYAIAVFVNVPLALVGGVVALSLRGLPFSIPAAVGFIAVAGVAVLNGVVMAGDLVRRLGLSAGTLDEQIRRERAARCCGRC